MNAFVKTLIGDAWNLSVVAGLVLTAAVICFIGHAGAAAFVMPPLTLAGVAWLARH
jgi:hypothetical protein